MRVHLKCLAFLIFFTISYVLLAISKQSKVRISTLQIDSKKYAKLAALKAPVGKEQFAKGLVASEPVSKAYQRRSKPDFYDSYDFEAICKYEWEKISTFSFLRRDSSYYFIDRKAIFLNFIGYSKIINNFDYTITVDVEGEESNNVTIQGKLQWFHKKYDAGDICYYRIEIPIVLENLFPSIKNESNLDALIRDQRISIRIHVFDTLMKKGTETELDVIPKYLHKKILKKKSTMMCGKCFCFDQSEVKSMEWWLEINKRIGYERVSICNNSLRSSPTDKNGYHALFERYGDYVETFQFNCIPHFTSVKGQMPNSSHYVNSQLDLVDERGVFHPLQWALYDFLTYTMCYLRNAQDYRHITIVDTDEAIFPPLIEDQFSFQDNFEFVRKLSADSFQDVRSALDHLKCSRYTGHDSNFSRIGVDWDYRSKLEHYANDIISRSANYTLHASLYFQGSYQVTPRGVAKIMDAFDAYFNNASFDPSLETHLVKAFDETRVSHETFYANYLLTVKGAEEIEYVKNLLKIYKLFVVPYMQSIEPKLVNVSTKYARFFALENDYKDQLMFGKTFYDTMTAHSARHHWPQGPLFGVDKDIGKMSHFRDVYRIEPTVPLSVRRFTLDLNYLVCFFEPMLAEFNK